MTVRWNRRWINWWRWRVHRRRRAVTWTSLRIARTGRAKAWRCGQIARAIRRARRCVGRQRRYDMRRRGRHSQNGNVVRNPRARWSRNAWLWGPSWRVARWEATSITGHRWREDWTSRCHSTSKTRWPDRSIGRRGHLLFHGVVCGLTVHHRSCRTTRKGNLLNI